MYNCEKNVICWKLFDYIYIKYEQLTWRFQVKSKFSTTADGNNNNNNDDDEEEKEEKKNEKDKHEDDQDKIVIKK